MDDELLQAAKAAIDCWDDPGEPAVMHVEKLRASVERAEKQGAVGFDDWWEPVEGEVEI